MNRMGVFARGIAVAWLALCAGCGGGDDSGGGTSPPPPGNTGIGAAGGTVSESSGAKVVIPAGALAADTPIAVAQSSTGAPPLPAGVAASGPIYAFTPHGTTFAKPVTITVPFDPASVPAGATPVLYKTDAQGAWQVVSGATVSGGTMVGDVTGFSSAVVTITPTMKHWSVELYDHKGDRESLLQGDQTGGPVDLEDWLYLPRGEYPTYWVHSTDSGRTFWTQSVAPTGGGSYIGARTSLTQTYYFRVEEESPTLHFLITHASLKAFDGGGAVASRYACPWIGPNPSEEDLRILCNGQMTRAEAAFHIEARSLSATPLLYRAGGAVEVTGVHADWRPLVTGDLSEHTLFHTGDFEFLPDADDSGTGRLFVGSLIAAKRVELPIETLHKGDIFSVQVFIKTTAIDYIQGESLIGALLQDPLGDAGIDLETTGLAQLPPQPDVPASPPALSCTGGPTAAAGKLQLSQAAYSEPERSETAAVYVDRVGGATGEVSVHVQTGDGVASTGADYQPASIEVRFADGDDARRRVEVPLVNDDTAEDDEALNVTLSDVGGCAQLGATTSATLTILDDDRPIPVQPTFTLGGTVTGLAGSGLTLRTNFINNFQPTADGPFTFPRRLDDGTQYSVSVEAQPTNPAQICSVTHGSGTIAGADVSNVQVSCTTPPPVSGIDTSFGSQGKVFTPPASARVLAQQADGKLLALGTLSMMRYNADGTPDASFGNAGKVDIVTSGSALDTMNAFAVQSDGKIVVVGHTTVANVPNDNWVMFRYKPDGSLDTSFGSGGRVETDFDGHYDAATGVMLTSTSKIVVTGYA
ncbi:MAG TPA: Calx-beta domain-containing protein, partial [Steroidobacteraceae bacterium]